MSHNISHGSESRSVRAKDGVIILDKGKSNKQQWKREIHAGLCAEGIENMAIHGWNKNLTLIQAMGLDTGGQAERKLKTLNILAASAEEEKGATAISTFEERIRAAAGASTPMKRPLESDRQFKLRQTAEQTGVAFSNALQQLEPEQREGFTGVRFFLDPETGKIETAEILAKRMKVYGRLILSSLRDHHSDLIAAVAPGDIAGLLRKVTRDTAESIKHSKSSLMDELKTIKRQGTVEATYDLYTEAGRTYARIFGCHIDEDLMVQRFIACMNTHPDKTFIYLFYYQRVKKSHPTLLER